MLLTDIELLLLLSLGAYLLYFDDCCRLFNYFATADYYFATNYEALQVALQYCFKIVNGYIGCYLKAALEVKIAV